MTSARKAPRFAAPSERAAAASGVRARAPLASDEASASDEGAVLLREAVEGVVSAEVARHAIATAVAASRKPFPSTLDDVRAFVRGPLARQLRCSRLDDEADEIIARITRLLARAGACVPLDDDEPTRPIHRLSLRPVAQPKRERVRALVLATGTTLADALRACPRADDLSLLCVATEAALTGALHASGSVIVLIDASAIEVEDALIVTALCARPSQLSALIVGADLPRGGSLLRALNRAGVTTIGVVGGAIPSLAEILLREPA